MRDTFLPCVFLCLTAACGGATDGGDEPSSWPVDQATGLRVAALGPVPALPEWPDNPPTDAKADLGKQLFSDARLSGSQTIPCGGCHVPTGQFQDSTSKTVPARSFPYSVPTLHRNATSMLNIVYAPVYRWDGSHSTDLIDVMVLPFAEANMNLTPGVPPEDVMHIDVPLAQETLKTRLTVDLPGYATVFQGAFGEDIAALPPEEVWRLAGSALAVYIRRAVSRDAPFDRWNQGDDSAMSEEAVRGLGLFLGKAGCINCHSGPFFSDFEFHNVGTSPPGEDGARPDEGRMLVTGKVEDGGKFLTPMLRSVDLTSPYLHDGSLTTLRDVIALKTSLAFQRDALHDVILDTMEPLDAGEVDDIVQFLKALRGTAIASELLAPPFSFP
jgi:cytochrome c peroxidase